MAGERCWTSTGDARPERDPSSADKPRKTVTVTELHTRQTVLAAVLMATAVVCALYLNVSFTLGKLSRGLIYDDISYVNEAYARYVTLVAGGPWRFLVELVAVPPHSLLSSLLGLISISFFGLRDAGFYIVNSLLLLGLSLFLFANFYRPSRLALAWIWGLFLLSPFSYGVIENFRPDFAQGIVTALIAWFGLGRLFLRKQRFDIYAGLCLAAALLIKPSFFAHTAAMAAGVAAVAVAYGAFSKQWTIARGVLLWLLIGALIAAPYYALSGREIFEYFWTHTRGTQAHLWSMEENVPLLNVAATFLLTGFQRFGGAQLWLCIGIVLVGVPILVLARQRERALFTAFLMFAAAGSFLVLTIGRHKSEFFFLTFQVLVYLAAATCVHAAAMRKSDRQKVLGAALLFAGLAACVAANFKYIPWPSSSDNLRARNWNRIIAEQIGDYMREQNWDGPAIVYSSSVGSVGVDYMRWEAAKMGVSLQQGTDAHRSARLDEHLQAAATAHFVVLPYMPAAEYYRWLPSATVQADVVSALLRDPDFEPIEEPNRQQYLLLRNLARLTAMGDVFDIPYPGAVEGFLDEEGPYPQWNLPRVAWMQGNSAKVCLYAEGTYRLDLRLRSSADAAIRVVSDPGTILASSEQPAGAFREVSATTTWDKGGGCFNLVSEAADSDHLFLFSEVGVSRMSEE